MATAARSAVAAGMVLVGTVATEASDPKVPPGNVPAGEPVAVLTLGIDYTRPEIAARLARDGEAELIGWDFVDNDRMPYVASPAAAPPPMLGNDAAVIANLASPAASGVTQPGYTIVPIRIDAADPVSFAKALSFAARTPARRVLVPFRSTDRAQWAAFGEAARHFKDLAIYTVRCTAGGAGTAPVFPADLGVLSVIVADADRGDADDRGTQDVGVVEAIKAACQPR